MLNLAASFTRTDVRAVAGGGLVLGSVAGYFAGRAHFKKQALKIADEEVDRQIEAYKDSFERRYKVGKYATPEEASAEFGIAPEAAEFTAAPIPPKSDYQQRVEDLDYTASGQEGDRITVRTPTEQVTVTVDPLEERHESVMGRDPNRPYVVSQQEFLDGEVGYDQVTVTYYSGDGQLCDENEQIMDDIEGSVGIDNLDRFGLQSEDENIVYVRNERIGLDYEIIRDPGLYSVIVAGQTPVIRGVEDPEQTFEPMRRTPRRHDDG